MTLKSASSSLTIIGETNQTGAITIASSSQALTLNLGTGTAAATVNIATSASLLHTLNIGTPSSTTLLQGNTVTIASSTDALTLNLGANTGRHTINIATGQASSTITIGSSSSTISVKNFVTAFPSNPVDGQEIIYAADSTNGVFWHFKYYASTTKWIFTGGPPLVSVIDTFESTTSASYAALATAGPSVTLPFAGDYDIVLEAGIYQNANFTVSYFSYDIGGTGAVDGDALQSTQGGGAWNSAPGNPSRFSQRKTGLTAATLTAKYKTSANTSVFGNRRMIVTPVQK